MIEQHYILRNGYTLHNKYVEILYGGKWRKADVIVDECEKDLYRVVLETGLSYISAFDDINLGKNKNILTKDLKRGDCLKINSKILDYGRGSYEQGIMVAAQSFRDECEKCDQFFMINQCIPTACRQFGIDRIVKFEDLDCANLIPFFKKYGNININCIDESLDFKKGLLDGVFVITNGHINNKNYIENLRSIIVSIGRIPKGNDHYISVLENGRNYIEVQSLQKLDYKGNVYHFRMESGKQYIALPCGVVTHM